MARAMKTEVKVCINSDKCKIRVFEAVADLPGIDQMGVDKEKGLLTILGDVDPVRVIKRVKKIQKAARFISIIPPTNPDQPRSPTRNHPCECQQPSACTIL